MIPEPAHAPTVDPAHPVPAPTADTAAPPAAPLNPRRERALAEIAAYRAANPDDIRTDAELLVAPNGGFELADLEIEYQRFRGARMVRLARSKRVAPATPATPN